MISFLKKYFFKHTFLLYSYFLHILFSILDLLPHFVRFLFFKTSFKKYGKNVMIDYKTYFRYMKNIQLGDNVSINRGCELFTSANLGTEIILHNNITLSPNVKLYGAGHDYKYLDLPDTSGDIIIGENVWIGANTIVLQGVVIGEGAVVSANSVVSKNIPAFSVVSGIPAKVVKERVIEND